MLKINNSLPKLSFNGGERKVVVKIGRKAMSVDEYVDSIDRDILANKELNYFRTCNFGLKQLEKFNYKCEKEAYDKIIARCFSDIDEAARNDAPKETINKLEKILANFILKFGDYYSKKPF